MDLKDGRVMGVVMKTWLVSGMGGTFPSLGMLKDSSLGGIRFRYPQDNVSSFPSRMPRH